MTAVEDRHVISPPRQPSAAPVDIAERILSTAYGKWARTIPWAWPASNTWSGSGHVQTLAEDAGLEHCGLFARAWHLLLKGSIISAMEGDQEAAELAR